MIMELYGLPGSGKSTIIKDLTGGSETSVSGVRGIKSLILPLAKKLAVYMPSSIKCKRRMTLILKSYDNRPKYVNRSRQYQYNNIVLVMFGYRNIRSNIYMDEGLIHRIVSMAVNYEVTDTDLFALIDIFEPVLRKIKCFYLDVSPNDSLQAIRLRDRHECEMDEFDDNKMMAYLKAYEHYFQMVCNRYGHSIVTRVNYEIMR